MKMKSFESRYPYQTMVLDTSTVTPPAGTGVPTTEEISSEVLWNGRPTWKLRNDHPTSGDAYWTIDLPTPYPGNGEAPSMFVPIYVQDFSVHYGPDVYLRIGSDWANRLEKSLNIGPSGAVPLRRNGWHMFQVTPNSWSTVTGTPDYNNDVEGFRVHIPNYPGYSGGVGATFYVGPVYCGIRARPKLLIYADDVIDTFITNGLPIFDSYGIKVHFATAKNWVGQAGYWSLAQAQSALANGHYICGHSSKRVGVGELITVPLSVADLVENTTYVRDVIGDTENYKHWVWANGQYWITDTADMSVIDAVAAQTWIKSARGTGNLNYFEFGTLLGTEGTEGKHTMFDITMLGPWSSTTTDTQLMDAIDDLIAGDGFGSLVFHGITDDSGAGVINNLTMLDNVASHIKAKYDAGLLDLPRAIDCV